MIWKIVTYFLIWSEMAHPFRVFDLIHKVVNSLEIIKRITREMIIDFEEQNVIYLEIRTTPKVFIQLI